LFTDLFYVTGATEKSVFTRPSFVHHSKLPSARTPVHIRLIIMENASLVKLRVDMSDINVSCEPILTHTPINEVHNVYRFNRISNVF